MTTDTNASIQAAVNASTASASALAERAMLVSLRMSLWQPPKVDRALTQSLAAQHGVTPDMVKAIKYVIPLSTPSYAALHTAQGAMRTAYYWYTLPWAHKGPRILPAVLFAKFADAMRQCRQVCDDAAQVFAGEFPRLQQLSIANGRGIITAADFPDDIRTRIGVDLQVMPIPQMPDFRLDMSDSQAAALKEQMRAGLAAQERDALANATREPFKKLFVHLTRMVERLNGVKANGNPADFRDSLVDGLLKLTAVIPALNITGDPQLADIADAAQAMVRGVSADQLREVPVIRARVAADAADLIKRITPHVISDNTLTPEADAVMKAAGEVEVAMGAFTL